MALKIVKSGAAYSKITGIGEKVRKLEQETGEKYLYLNQGVNAVCNIKLNEVVKLIDFNSRDIQVYPPMKGRPVLKEAINEDYFNSKSNAGNILITGGGMSGLDLVFQTIDVENFYLPTYFWGSYFNILTIRKKTAGFYESYDFLKKNINKFKNSAVVICDPNNPIGDKFNDKDLTELINNLADAGAVVIIDSPYRKVFFDKDLFYENVCFNENVILVESFSKSIGLSGQRIGFIHSVNNDFIDELTIRLMYSTNGINGFAQLLVEKIYTTKEGKKAATEFKQTTRSDIKKNIDYLKTRGFIAGEFFNNSQEMGIFTVVNLSEEFLLQHKIASVSLSFFTRKNKEYASNFSRICVSVPHDKLKTYFDKI